MDIYQKIWDADQSESGIVPMLDTESGDATIGYVKVNSNLDTQDKSLRALPEVIIPDSKRRTYDLCREVFDNFALPERDEENDTAEEREEVHDLVHAMVDTAPMQVAREYVAQATGSSISRERWYNTLMELWFRRFSQGGDPHLSGFEHVVVGEQEGAKAKGYHFWYKYYLDDGFARMVDDAQEHFPGLVDDRIVYLGTKQKDAQDQFPESITISYRWDAPDYDQESLRPLTKPIGGFFVGCSIEGLLAIGSVRAHLGASAPKQCIINGAKYNLKMFRSANKRHVRTFYPAFTGPAESDNGDNGNGEVPLIAAGMIRIVAALVNPKGHDPGYETVTLINIGDTVETLMDWRLEDKRGRFQSLNGLTIGAGDCARIHLDQQGAQLSNKGGSIRVVNANGHTIHTVTYSKGQTKANGQTIMF